MIRLDHVSKTYNSGDVGEHTAVADVGLTIAERHITVLKGPSGSGKTTLLSLIGCMARPTSGRIYFQDKEVTSLPERFLARLRQQQVGFVFQNYNLINGISVLDNIILPALPLGISHQSICRRAATLIEQLGIQRSADQPVQHLSGGEQQRVAIARALINQPSLVIADEPTAHLDTQRSEQFMDIMDRLRSMGRTVLIASHDPLVCSHRVVDRMVSMHDGQIIESSPPQ